MARLSDGIYVLAFRGPGDNFPSPVAPPIGSVLISYAQDGDGGTWYLYEFSLEDEGIAQGFADLTRGQVYDDEATARDAYQEATSA
jgi:hypothetical protein